MAAVKMGVGMLKDLEACEYVEARSTSKSSCETSSCSSNVEEEDTNSAEDDISTDLSSLGQPMNLQSEHRLQAPPTMSMEEHAKETVSPDVVPRVWAVAAARAFEYMYPLSKKDGDSGAGSAPRLDALDAMRWIGSIQIVIFHMYLFEDVPKSWRTTTNWLSTWTQLFFLLSAFVLAYAEMMREGKKGAEVSLLEYLRRRLTVIYPSFIFALLLKVAIGAKHTKFEWQMLPLNVLLMQAWLPLVDGHDGGPWLQAWVPDAWFLSVLVLYWMILRPLSRFFAQRSLGFCMASLFGCWALSTLPQLFLHDNQLANWVGCKDVGCTTAIFVAIKGGALGYIHVFVAGVAASRVFVLTCMCWCPDASSAGGSGKGHFALDSAGTPLLMRFGCCFGYGLYLAGVLLTPFLIDDYHIFFHNGGMLPVMLLILLGAAAGSDPIAVWAFRSKPMLLLGRISYNQYLLQSVVHGWVVSSFGWDSTAKALYLPLLMVVAYSAQRWVERPYSDYQRWRQAKGIKGCDDRCIEVVDARCAVRCACC
eukprot:CAMPEP_0203867574 /NCGR_PEP_ID=MMETSP0359-20131031/16599_1 /ASSEMBLY_ACC=CAM_ASM_000338 /TAXON_ID=268821 /ORGANISM="Scrippsiella Hangoei, Strain SHTV-5" /LENGTH=533 /DNA_ID=CAMNT_0050785837 /DNA_START=44 /DNA_END=1645 /DNA_ORIENTATION=+